MKKLNQLVAALHENTLSSTVLTLTPVDDLTLLVEASHLSGRFKYYFVQNEHNDNLFSVVPLEEQSLEDIFYFFGCHSMKDDIITEFNSFTNDTKFLNYYVSGKDLDSSILKQFERKKTFYFSELIRNVYHKMINSNETFSTYELSTSFELFNLSDSFSSSCYFYFDLNIGQLDYRLDYYFTYHSHVKFNADFQHLKEKFLYLYASNLLNKDKNELTLNDNLVLQMINYS